MHRESCRYDGNPFEFSIYDFEGRLAIDLGVYGAPETFFIDKNGLIRERHVGVIDERVWEEKFSNRKKRCDDLTCWMTVSQKCRSRGKSELGPNLVRMLE